MNKKLEGLKAGLFNGIIVHREVWEDQELTLSSFLAILNNGLDTCKPHYFPLSSLTKEIRVEGYNDGKAFKMIDEMAKEFLYAAEWFTDIKEGQLSIQGFIYDNDEGVEVKQIVLINGEVSEECPLIHYRQMVKLHFNTEGIDPSDYIDASESKVYEPKKHESC